MILTWIPPLTGQIANQGVGFWDVLSDSKGAGVDPDHTSFLKLLLNLFLFLTLLFSLTLLFLVCRSLDFISEQNVLNFMPMILIHGRLVLFPVFGFLLLSIAFFTNTSPTHPPLSTFHPNTTVCITFHSRREIFPPKISLEPVTLLTQSLITQYV